MWWREAKSSPKNSERACLCEDSNTYSRKCCKGGLQNQGIGKTQTLPSEQGDFKRGEWNNSDWNVTT